MFRRGPFEIVGFRVEDSFIELDPGVIVLFGRNGAGKTRTLESLEGLQFSRNPNYDLRAELIVRLVNGGFHEAPNPREDLPGIGLTSVTRMFYERFLTPEQRSQLEAGWGTLNRSEVEELLDQIAEGMSQLLIHGNDRDELSQQIGDGYPSGAIDLAWDAVRDHLFAIYSQVRIPDRDKPLVREETLVAPIIMDDEAKQSLRHSFHFGDTSKQVVPGTNMAYLGCSYSLEGNLGGLFDSLWAGDVDDLTRSLLSVMQDRLRESKEPQDVDAVVDGLPTSKHLPYVTRWYDLVRQLGMNKGETPVRYDSQGDFDWSCRVGQVLDYLVRKANAVYQQLFLDAPRLELSVPSVGKSLSMNVSWTVSVGDRTLSLENLSAAEKKWAVLSIQFAHFFKSETVFFIDEPEAGLHRSAEANLARELQDLAEEENLCLVIASHSPEFLNSRNSGTYMVRHERQRENGEAFAQRLSSEDREELLAFGLLPGDILRRQRGFLLVEGEHDQIIWDVLLGAELRELRVEVLPMRGAKNLKTTFDSRVLFDFTDAHLFGILDALNAEFVSDTWVLAKDAKESQGLQFAVDEIVLPRMAKLKVDEAGFMQAFITRALQDNRESRVSPIGLSKVDILDYLPVDAFVPDAPSWDSLREACEKSLGKTPSGTDFKNWLKKARKADLTLDGVRAAAQKCDYIPEDFTRALDEVRQVLEY